MAHETWEHVNRLRAQGVQVGDYLEVDPSFRGLGALGGKKSRRMLAALMADSEKAVKIKARLDREMATLATQADVVSSASQQASALFQQASDLASQVDDPNVLRSVERMEQAVAQLETLAGQAEDALASLSQAQVPSGPPELQGTPEDPANVAAWLLVGVALDKSKGVVGSMKSKANTLLNQAKQGAKAVQVAYQRAQDAAQRKIDDELKQEQKRLDAEYRKEQAELRREQQRIDMENRRYAAEQARDAALYAPQAPAYQAPAYQAPAYDPYQYQAPLPAPPTGYQYQQVAPAVQYQPQYGSGIPQQYAQVQYADQPASWGYAQPQQVFQPAGWQVPAPAPQSLTPGWTTLEFSALQAGEGNYLWGLKGLRGLGKEAAPAPTGQKTGTFQWAPGTTAGSTGGDGARGKIGTSTMARTGSAFSSERDMEESDSWLPSGKQVSDALMTALNVAGDLLPSFLRPQQAAPAPVEQPSMLPTIAAAAAGVAVVGGLAYAASKAMSGGGGSRGGARRRTYRRRGR